MTFVLWEIPGHDNVLGGVGLRTKGYALFILDHRGDTVNRRFPKEPPIRLETSIWRTYER